MAALAHGRLGVPVGDVVEEPVCIGETNAIFEYGVPLDQLYLSKTQEPQFPKEHEQPATKSRFAKAVLTCACLADVSLVLDNCAGLL